MNDWYAGSRKDDCDGMNEFCERRSLVAEIDHLRAGVARLSAEPDEATVERVAHAVYEEDGYDDWTEEWYQVRRTYHRLARAAIAALPTPAPGGEA